MLNKKSMSSACAKPPLLLTLKKIQANMTRKNSTYLWMFREVLVTLYLYMRVRSHTHTLKSGGGEGIWVPPPSLNNYFSFFEQVPTIFEWYVKKKLYIRRGGMARCIPVVYQTFWATILWAEMACRMRVNLCTAIWTQNQITQFFMHWTKLTHAVTPPHPHKQDVTICYWNFFFFFSCLLNELYFDIDEQTVKFVNV